MEFSPELSDGNVEINDSANTTSIMGSHVYTKLELYVEQQSYPILTIDSTESDNNILVPFASVSIKDPSTNDHNATYSDSTTLKAEITYKNIVPNQESI